MVYHVSCDVSHSIYDGIAQYGIGCLDDPRGHWRSWPWPWIEAKSKTFLRLEKSPEHFPVNDADFAVSQFAL